MAEKFEEIAVVVDQNALGSGLASHDSDVGQYLKELSGSDHLRAQHRGTESV